MTTFAVTWLDYGLWRSDALRAFLDGPLVVDFGGKRDVVRLGWGRKPSGRRACLLAKRGNGSFALLEDGFLRSVEPGSNTPPLSIVLDDLGVYYDASTPSRLESLIAEPLLTAEIDRAHRIIEQWKLARVSKYNNLREYTKDLSKPYVLVADQVHGDASIIYGLATSATFDEMVFAALDENPQCDVLIKVHPDVQRGHRKGCINLEKFSPSSRVRIIADEVHSVSLVERAVAIYTVTSQLGFEGLLWGKRVRVFGMPFYAGWGLTNDSIKAPARRSVHRKDITVAQLAYAGLVKYPRYVDPETGQRCEIELILQHLGLQRSARERFPRHAYGYRFSKWKKPIVKRFLQGTSITFADRQSQIPKNSHVLVWGKKGNLADVGQYRSVSRLEDGFLRSVGLGADLITPLSWVIDSQGIYYDSSRESALEGILSTYEFESSILNRAKLLRTQIVEGGVTKYNTGIVDWMPRNDASHTILIPGQVESDASILYGRAPESPATNMELVQAVRSSNPGAYLIYKPHPDVTAGLRESDENTERINSLCDEVVINVSMDTLLRHCHEVHVLTSLTGFEALLRGKRVVCHGQPFYSGWGLTVDLHPVRRRQRVLTIDELVAGTLIHYPLYVSRVSGRYTTPERALDELLKWRQWSGREISLFRKIFRLVLRASNRLDI